MRNLFTFLLCVLFVSTLSAQKPYALIPKASVAPEVGGGIDVVWDEAEKNNIDKVYINENPTVGEEGDTYWKGLWTNDGIYVLVYVADDDYYPYYQRVDETQTSKTRFDQVEIFFDCNYEKVDGLGGWEGGNSGHYKFAPATTIAADAGFDDGTLHEDYYPDLGYQYSIDANDDPHYFVEYFVPFTSLKDEDGVGIDIQEDIGFEVSVIDNDEPGGNNDRNRMVWANWENGDDDSWDNMDDAGIIELDGAQTIYITNIALTGGDITQDNQTFQIGVELESDVPGLEPTDKTLKWVIDPSSTARARLSDDGLVTPITNGVFTVYALSSDEFVESDPININISGQIVEMEEVSLIKNGLFNEIDEDLKPTGGWSIGTGGTVVDGVAWCTPPNDGAAHNPWDWQLSQNIIPITMDEINDPFIFKFKMWSDVADTATVDFEDSRNSYSRYGVSTDPESNGTSEWTFVTNTEETTYEFHVTFSNMAENANQRMQIMLGRATPNVYVDSVFLIKEADLALIATGVQQNRLETQVIEVYPNPANDVINVTLEKGNTNIAIYNSVGIKMEEIRVEGTHHVFNVSDYSPGIYFVKANNTVVKFVK